MNIAQNIERATVHFPDRPAIVFENQVLTYRDLQAAVDRASHGLTAMGVGVGDRLALYLPNIPAFPIGYLAVQKIGAIAVSVNAMLTTDEVHHVITDSGARTAFTTADLLPRLQPLLEIDIRAERVVFGNVVSNMYATGHALRIDPVDRLLLFLPLFHCFGQNFIMNSAFNSGASIVLHRRFVPQAILESIVRDGVSMFFGTPTVYITLLNAGAEPRHLKSIRYYFSAAATMPVEVAIQWQKTFGQPVYEGYGLTETSPFASYNHAWAHRPGSVGTPVEMVELKVVDLEDREVAPNEWGEILIKGPNVMLGYWNRPDETAAALRGGWFHTGDIGYVDPDGYVYLVDRVKDMINAGGFKIWPREVEEVLYQHSAIKECAVVGVPDALKGETARAVVILQSEAEVTVEDLKEYCRAHLAAYKVPQHIEFVAELPKSATGKILKRVLRAQAASP